MSELLNPYNDFVFKRIFGSEENKNDVLLHFLNEVLHETESQPFTEITLLNTYLEKDAPEDKQSILDIRAETESGTQVNIEIQVMNKPDMPKRSLYYWAKMYEEQLESGEQYINLKKTITINIINFELFSNDRFHNTFHLTEDHTQERLIDDIEVHFMELPKIRNRSHQKDNRLVRWLRFVTGAETKESWEELAMDTPGLRKAMDTLEFLSQDKAARALALAREKAIRDEISALAWAESKGESRKQLEIAKNLLHEGDMSISRISRLTGLDEEEIEKLKNDTQ